MPLTLDPPMSQKPCWRTAQALRAAFLVDAAAYYEAFAEAAQKAERTIYILAWDIHGGIRLQRDRPYETLRGFFHRLLDARPGLHIYILNWDFPLVYAHNRELLPLFDAPWRKHPRLHFRWDARHPTGACHHQKVAVIDDRLAFSGGLDFTDERWDMPSHLGKDRRRRDLRQNRYQPFHDTTLMVEGEAARWLGELARGRWRRSGGSEGNAGGAPPSDAPSLWPSSVQPDLENVQVGIARTEPAYEDQPEVREVERLFVEEIRAARHYVYIENQYFTSRVIAEAIAARLQEVDGPEIVLVLPQGCSGWLEEASLGILRARTIRALRALDPYGRLHVYYPTVAGLEKGMYIKVHSKVLITDDRFLKIGSANACNRSLGLDTECDLAINAADNPDARKTIARFRDRLLAEHLGTTPDHIADLIEKNGSLAGAIKEGGGPRRRLVSFAGEVSPFWEALIPHKILLDPEQPLDVERRMRRDLRIHGHRREARRQLLRSIPYWFMTSAAFPLLGLWRLRKRLARRLLSWM
jgi:phospholipase D1/2